MTAGCLEGYVNKLIANNIPDSYVIPYKLETLVNKTLERVEFCFSHIKRKYYQKDGKVIFDHLNADHMVTFLYFLGNTVWRETNDTELPLRLSYLNKIMHGIDLFYSINMPNIFLMVHPVGTVLGNASYRNYLVIYQNCTVGATTTMYPTFGEGVVLYSRCSVIGDCRIGDNVVFAANSQIVNSNVPENSMVSGFYPNQRLTTNKLSVRKRCFE